MEKKTTLKGMWWVKGNEDDKFVGILTYASGYIPTLEIYPKHFEFDAQKVSNGSTLYGDVFGDSRKIQAITLLGCTSQHSWGTLDVGAFLYKQEYVYADCVAIGMLLYDDEIAQVQSPKNIYLTCPGLDEYSAVQTLDYVWKDNIPSGKAYRINDLDKIVFTPPDPIEIKVDIGTITISLGPSSNFRDLTSRYSIHICLKKPTPEAEVNKLIYEQLLSFLSIMTGRREYIDSHHITITSDQTRTGSLGLDLSYGHINHSKDEAKFNVLHTLLLGRDLNSFVDLFPMWRMNFEFVKDLAFHYMEMIEQPNQVLLLRAFSIIEHYVLERLTKRNSQRTFGVFQKFINVNVDYFQDSELVPRYFPADQRDHIACQLTKFRNKSIHPKSNKESIFSFNKVYAYIFVLLRLNFLREMECPCEVLDRETKHWSLWRQLEVD